MSIGILLPLLSMLSMLLDSPAVYKQVMRYVVAGFISLLFYPFVYGLYLKQVRQPMMRLLKSTSSCKCKSAAVASQPQRNRITRTKKLTIIIDKLTCYYNNLLCMYTVKFIITHLTTGIWHIIMMFPNITYAAMSF